MGGVSRSTQPAVEPKAGIRLHDKYQLTMNKGHAEQKPPQALLLIDVINNFEFPDGEVLLRRALEIAPHMSELKRRAAKAGIPIIYLSENFGQWRLNSAKLVASCLHTDCPGRTFVEQVQPSEEDYCVLKPMHSAFYRTPLDVLLRRLTGNFDNSDRAHYEQLHPNVRPMTPT